METQGRGGSRSSIDRYETSPAASIGAVVVPTDTARGLGNASGDRWQGLTWKDLSDEPGQALHDSQHSSFSQPLIGHMRCVITAKHHGAHLVQAAQEGAREKGGTAQP